MTNRIDRLSMRLLGSVGVVVDPVLTLLLMQRCPFRNTRG